MGIYGNLSIEELETLYNNFNITHIPSVLVETGTYQGDSIEAVHALFECIYTIEIDEQRYVAAKDRLKDLTHLNFLHGDSLSLLPVVLDKCKKPIFFMVFRCPRTGRCQSTVARGDRHYNQRSRNRCAVAFCY